MEREESPPLQYGSMMPTDEERIANLEREVRRLDIRIETLVNFLNTSHFGPPLGRDPYDVLVESNLAEFGLKDSSPEPLHSRNDQD